MKTKSSLFLALVLAGFSLAPSHGADTILHNFSSGSSDGSYPYGSLTISGSKLYGMTSNGGGTQDSGTIFSINANGTGFTKLHSFVGGGNDGSTPQGSLTLVGSRLYGMTSLGGNTYYGGTIFSMNTDGTGFSLMHNFTGNGNDGYRPEGSLTLGGSTLYGMAETAVFSIDASGSGFTLLHTLQGSEGSQPLGSLTLSGSKLYGMASTGGGKNLGTVFSMNTDGSGFNVLHSFTGGLGDGANPHGSLTLIGSKLYGMTYGGGDPNSNPGTIFTLDMDGTGYKLLHTFDISDAKNGFYPFGSLTLYGSTLYGTTQGGGANGLGTIFSINADGSNFSLVQNFGGVSSDGTMPSGDVTLSADGRTLYGMTLTGGTGGLGTIFSVPVPEPGSCALLAFGGVGLLCGCKRLRSRKRQ